MFAASALLESEVKIRQVMKEDHNVVIVKFVGPDAGKTMQCATDILGDDALLLDTIKTPLGIEMSASINLKDKNSADKKAYIYLLDQLCQMQKMFSDLQNKLEFNLSCEQVPVVSEPVPVKFKLYIPFFMYFVADYLLNIFHSIKNILEGFYGKNSSKH